MPKRNTDTANEETRSSATVAEIADAAAAMEQLNDVEDPAATLPEGFDPANVPTIEQAMEDAKIPEHKKASQLLGRPVVFVSWRPQRGFLASTGEYRPGMFCVIMDVETKKVSTVWIGQVALYKILTKVKPPFRATITQSGRTLVFS